jgi:hypothetical protein
MTIPELPLPPASPADVAAWLRARTQDNEGREIGLWTEATRPSVDQVESHLVQARVLLSGEMGVNDLENPGPCGELYEAVVALQAALIIEKSYFPEQIATARSPYAQLQDELTSAKESLRSCLISGGLGPGSGEEGSGSGGYDIATPTMVYQRPMIPANWNDPYAEVVDVPEEGNPATQWLLDKQASWKGTQPTGEE